MKEKFLCVMAQYDKETEKKLKEIQKLLQDHGFVGRQTPNLPNHITLGSFDISQEELLKEKLKIVSQHFSSFDIKLNNIKYSEFIFNSILGRFCQSRRT